MKPRHYWKTLCSSGLGTFDKNLKEIMPKYYALLKPETIEEVDRQWSILLPRYRKTSVGTSAFSLYSICKCFITGLSASVLIRI